MSEFPRLAPRPWLSGVGHAAVAGPATPGIKSGVRAMIRDGFGLATILARRGASDALNRRVQERFGIDLPHGPRRSAASGVVFAGTGPGAWLVLTERDEVVTATNLPRGFRASWTGWARYRTKAMAMP